jgi:hypothetical protein
MSWPWAAAPECEFVMINPLEHAIPNAVAANTDQNRMLRSLIVSFNATLLFRDKG